MRKILTYGGYFEDFLETLPEDVVRKIDYGLVLLKSQERLPTKFVKHIEDGLFELRIEWESDIYRVFFIIDNGNIVVLFNGFQKKAQKTPRREIDKAKRIMAEYYETQKGSKHTGL